MPTRHESSRLILRLFARCATEAAVADVGARLHAALAAEDARQTAPPQRYWKLAELVEFTFEPAQADEACHARLLARAPAGWHHGGDATDRSSVWNAQPGVELLLPEVQWAEFILTLRGGAHDHA